MKAVLVFGMGLRGAVCESAAPAFVAPGIVGGGVKERFQRGNAGGYDGYV